MNDYLKIIKQDEFIDLIFLIENDNIMAIGEKLEGVNENAYMNGYNWEAVLNCYIEQNAPELFGTYDTDSEAGMYAAYFENSPEGEKNAEAMAELITSLIENEEKLIEFVEEYGDDIEWD